MPIITTKDTVKMTECPSVMVVVGQFNNFIASNLLIAEFAYRCAERGISWESVARQIREQVKLVR